MNVPLAWAAGGVLVLLLGLLMFASAYFGTAAPLSPIVYFYKSFMLILGGIGMVTYGIYLQKKKQRP